MAETATQGLNLTFLSTKALSEKLKEMAPKGAPPAYTYGSLKSMATAGHPAATRKFLSEDSKRARVVWVWEWFLDWQLEGVERPAAQKPPTPGRPYVVDSAARADAKKVLGIG